MKVRILREAGYEEAMLGLSLSHNQPVENMPRVAGRLYRKDDGHNKFLESIVIWLDVTAPRYWWQQFDTYRVGVTKQSESTMNTVLRQQLSQQDFEGSPVYRPTLDRLNRLIEDGNFTALKRELPESFLQRRIVCLNYKVIRHIIAQRQSHRLQEWQQFVSVMYRSLEHGEFLDSLK